MSIEISLAFYKGFRLHNISMHTFLDPLLIVFKSFAISLRYYKYFIRTLHNFCGIPKYFFRNSQEKRERELYVICITKKYEINDTKLAKKTTFPYCVRKRYLFCEIYTYLRDAALGISGAEVCTQAVCLLYGCGRADFTWKRESRRLDAVVSSDRRSLSHPATSHPATQPASQEIPRSRSEEFLGGNHWSMCV